METNCPLYLGPEPVTAHVPAGDSIFAVSDLVGNVWQYTDEFQDEHSRYVILPAAPTAGLREVAGTSSRRKS